MAKPFIIALRHFVLCYGQYFLVTVFPSLVTEATRKSESLVDATHILFQLMWTAELQYVHIVSY